MFGIHRRHWGDCSLYNCTNIAADNSFRAPAVPLQCPSSSDSPERARLVKQQIAGLQAKPKRNKQCLYYKVETYWCKEGGGPPKGEVCKPTPAPVKAYSYNFETMQPTMSPTPQVP